MKITLSHDEIVEVLEKWAEDKFIPLGLEPTEVDLAAPDPNSISVEIALDRIPESQA